MSLETPNAFVAALVVLFNNMLPLADQFQTRSSVGIARQISVTSVPGPATIALYELEQPLSNDEAVVLGPPFALAPNNNTGFQFQLITPLAQQVGVPFADALPPNLLALSVGFPPNTKVRLSVAVQRLITTVAPIAGEPLP